MPRGVFPGGVQIHLTVKINTDSMGHGEVMVPGEHRDSPQCSVSKSQTKGPFKIEGLGSGMVEEMKNWQNTCGTDSLETYSWDVLFCTFSNPQDQVSKNEEWGGK